MYIPISVLADYLESRVNKMANQPPEITRVLKKWKLKVPTRTELTSTELTHIKKMIKDPTYDPGDALDRLRKPAPAQTRAADLRVVDPPPSAQDRAFMAAKLRREAQSSKGLRSADKPKPPKPTAVDTSKLKVQPASGIRQPKPESKQSPPSEIRKLTSEEKRHLSGSPVPKTSTLKKVDDTPVKLRPRRRVGAEEVAPTVATKKDDLKIKPTQRKPLDQLKGSRRAARLADEWEYKDAEGKRMAAVTKEELKESGHKDLTDFMNEKLGLTRRMVKPKPRPKAKAHGGMTKSKSRNGHTDFRGGGMIYNTAVKRG
jgi:hypothetical protein